MFRRLPYRTAAVRSAGSGSLKYTAAAHIEENRLFLLPEKSNGYIIPEGKTVFLSFSVCGYKNLIRPHSAINLFFAGQQKKQVLRCMVGKPKKVKGDLL